MTRFPSNIISLSTPGRTLCGPPKPAPGGVRTPGTWMRPKEGIAGTDAYLQRLLDIERKEKEKYFGGSDD